MRKIFFMLCLNAIMLSGIVIFFNLKLFFKVQENKLSTDFAKDVLTEVQDSKVILEEALIDKDGEIKSGQASLSEEQQKTIELSRKLSEKVNETLVLKDDLRKKDKIITDLQGQIEKEKERRKELLRQFDKARSEKEELEKRIEQFKGGVPFAAATQAVAIPREQTQELKTFPVASPPKIQGKVLEVNEDYNFLVTNLGANDSMKQGQILDVLRDDQLIGRARVEKIYDDMCTAVILLETFQDSGKPVAGDIIRILN